MYTASIISLFVCMCTCIAADPLPHGDISGVAFIGMSSHNMWRHFEGGEISSCSEISLVPLAQ